MEKQEEKPVQPPTEARSSVKNLISRFEKKPDSQVEAPSTNNPIVIEGRNSVSSMIKNIEKKVADNENKISGPAGSDNNVAQENEDVNPIQETNEQQEQSGLLDDYSQDNFSDVNTSNNAGRGFRNPIQDKLMYAQKNGLLDQSQDKSQEYPRPTAAFGEAPAAAPVQQYQNQFVGQADTSNIDQSESGLLDDMTENDESLNISGFKPMMNNPLGLNRSYLDPNKSQLDVSRSKLNYSNISHMDNKGQVATGLQFNFNANIDYAQNMDLRVQEFDDHVLSQMTDNTQDLSHLSVPGFKNVFYGKDNSYYLNMTGLDQSILDAVNRSQMQNKSMNKSANKSHNKTGIKDKSQHIAKEELNKSGNILDELHGPADSAQTNLDPSHFLPRPTANFGIEALGHPEERPHEEDPENMPRPTGQFGFVVNVQEATPQNATAEGNKSRIDVSQNNRSQLGVIDNEQQQHNKSQIHRSKEDSDDKIHDVKDEKDPFKLSQLDISKISVFDTTQDHEDFGANVTVNNMRAFLSHSRFGTMEHEKRDSQGEYDPDLTLELQQEINPEYKKTSLALNPDQPKISEVSIAKEDTQIMEESKRQIEEKLSSSGLDSPGRKNVSSDKEIISKSFNDKAGSSFIAQDSKNKSFDEAKQAVYNNYTNPFLTKPKQEEEIYEMRLTVGNLPAAVVTAAPIEVEKQPVTYTNPFTGLNKSYDASRVTVQDNATYLNKSYQNIPSTGKPDSENKFTRDFQGLGVAVQQSQGETNQEIKSDPNDELAKEGVELVDRMKNVYNDWKTKNEQFDGYLDEVKRFTFQQKPIDQIKIDRSFDIASKTPKENDRLHHSFDAGGLQVPQGQQQDVTSLSSYYKQDLLTDEKSFSDLNVSQEPASQFKKFVNPNFASAHQVEANAVPPSQDTSGLLGQKEPQRESIQFEGFTLGGSRKLVGEVPSEIQYANLLNKSLDFHLTESANARENLNKSYSAYTGKGFALGDVASQSKPESTGQLEGEKLNTSNNNQTLGESKTEGETPNFGNPQVSTSSLLEENRKELEGSATEYYQNIEQKEHVSNDDVHQRSFTGSGYEREQGEHVVRTVQVPKEDEKVEIKLPLIFRKQNKSRPQILVPRRTINVPSDGQVDFVIQKREEKKGRVSNNTYPGIEFADEKNVQRRFFGYKVRKDKFEREKHQRKINAEIETLDTTGDTQDSAETVVSEEVKELNRRLDELRTPSERLLNEIESDTNFSDDEDGQSTVSSIKSVRPLQVGKTGSKRTSAEGGNKMKFYSIAVNYRIDLPQEHPGKNISIADLYNEAMEQNMPENNWNGFLKGRICSGI